MNEFDLEINKKMKTEIAYKEFQLSQLSFKVKELKKEIKALKNIQKKFEETGMIIF